MSLLPRHVFACRPLSIVTSHTLPYTLHAEASLDRARPEDAANLADRLMMFIGERCEAMAGSHEVPSYIRSHLRWVIRVVTVPSIGTSGNALMGDVVGHVYAFQVDHSSPHAEEVALLACHRVGHI